MSWKDKAVALVKRYGAPAKFAAKVALGAVLPGGSAVVELVGAALDCAHETIRDQIELDEARMPAATAADLQRLEGVLDILSGDLGALTAQVAALEKIPAVAARLVDTALVTDERCQTAFCKLDVLGRGFDRLRDQNDRLLRVQGYHGEMLEDMRALLRRAAGVFEFVEELRAGGVSVADLRVQLAVFRDGERALAQGRIAEAGARLQEASHSQPQSGTAAAALAAAQAAGQDLAAAEKTLTQAARLRPRDKELGELQGRVTQASRGATPAEGGRGAVAPPKVGDILDGWRLEQMLGRGGWGQVFKASRGGEVRALKVMKPDLSRDPAFVERFKAEMLTLAALRRQKHLVEIHGFGYAADAACWYFLMEFVDGWSLEHYLARRGPLRQAQAVALFTLVAGGLAPVHDVGVVHLDVKPTNILLRKPYGLPVLVDFGLASAAGSGMTDCTPMFAAPEQLRGKLVDARTDVYALAASMYYALNYDKPEHREPDQFEAEQVPAALRELLTRALQPRPERRPANAAEFRDLLVRATADAGSSGQLQRQPGERFTNSIGMKFAWIPPGSFLMGSPPNEEERNEDETQHKVTLTKGFFMGAHQVTQTQWYKVMHRRRSTFRGKDLPVETINWTDAVKFCAKLSELPEEKQAGRVYRLPTEAEWEYACRAGTTTPFHFGETISSNNANYKADEAYGEGPAGEWRETTVPFGSFQPNSWGLYDMHGNVYEWCADWYGPYPEERVANPQGPPEGQGRVSRGGSWGHQPWECRSAARCQLEPYLALSDTGLRVCFSLGPEEAESVVIEPGSFLAKLRDRSGLQVGDVPTPADCLEAMLRLLHDAPETEDGQLPPETQQALARIAEAAQDPAKLRALLGVTPEEEEAEAAEPTSEADAHYNLGVLYANGQGVAQDDAEAARWYRKAAEQGNAEAQCRLGLMYVHGRGAPMDDAVAAKWCKKSAEQGNAAGQGALGFLYETGRGVAKDEAAAVQWYRKAAEQGDAYAEAQLNRIRHERGKAQQDGSDASQQDLKADEQSNQSEWWREDSEKPEAKTRLRQEGEAMLADLVRRCLDRTAGKPTADDNAAATEICRQYRIPRQRAEAIVRDVRKSWRQTFRET